MPIFLIFELRVNFVHLDIEIRLALRIQQRNVCVIEAILDLVLRDRIEVLHVYFGRFCQIIYEFLFIHRFVN